MTIYDVTPRIYHCRCMTCWNDSCSDCGQMFQSAPLHIYWHEDVCKECQDAHADWLEEYGDPF